ncbi:MAG: Metallo-beta-lactamase superfamily protein [Firmicutes bacterium]|nr:Metallo-beta-lactamase superfamily protein [Bacillota bacterium]
MVQGIIPLAFGVSSLYLIQGEGMIIIDTGSDVDKSAYIAAFRDLGVNPQDIRLIIISHGHSDHYARLAEVKELTGAPVLCHKLAARALETGENPEYVPRNKSGQDMLKLILETVPVMSRTVIPDILVEDEFDLKEFGIDGKIVPTPGHSECSLSVILDGGQAIVGDILVHSPIDGELCLAFLATDENKLFASLQKLLDYAEIFYGGHGGPYTKAVVEKLLKDEAQIFDKASGGVFGVK